MPRPRFSLETLLVVVTAIASFVGIMRVVDSWVYRGLLGYLFFLAAMVLVRARGDEADQVL
jgi:hypothetical protein